MIADDTTQVRSTPPTPRSRPASARSTRAAPLAGGRPNAVLALPDDRLLYLVALLHDTPQQPPALSPGA
jgi:hypothetical protein